MDSGADISILNVGGDFACLNTDGVDIRGIGGSQSTGLPMNGLVTFASLPDKTFDCSVNPTVIPGESNLLILGKNFLSQFDFTVFDWANNSVKLGNDNLVYLATVPDPSLSLDKFQFGKNLEPSQLSLLKSSIAEFPGVFAHNPKCPSLCAYGSHTINSTDDRVVRDKFRRTPHKWLKQIEDQVEEMCKNGIIQKSSSPFNSNVILVDKKDGCKRFCVDFKPLNKHTSPDTYPLPNIGDILDQLRGCNFYSQLDLASGYWGIPMNEEDIEKTAFSVDKGKYEFLRMPLG